MRICEDQAGFEWIARGRKPLLGSDDPLWIGNTVRNLLPYEFETYIKIFHRLEANYTSIDNPLSSQELAILKIPNCTPIRSLVERIRTDDEHVRVRWSQVAHALDLPFVTEITDEWFRKRLEPGCWARYIWGPGEGYLEADEYAEIASLLSEHPESEECFFRLPEIPHISTEQPLLFQGTVVEVTDIPVAKGWKTPEYWWPSSCDWCVCSDYDLSFTFIGGWRNKLSAILNSPSIEAIEVPADTRIDDLVPMPGTPGLDRHGG